MEHSILLVEDDELLAENIQTYLERKDFEVTVCHSAEEALEQMRTVAPDVVLTDNSLPGMSGHDLIQKLRISAPDLKVIMMTGYGNVEDAVVAMKEGAFHYVTKPVALPELKLLLDKALATDRMERTLSFYQEREAQKSGVQALIGESGPMLYLKSTIGQLLDAERRMANTDLPPVLVEGETGTGKELVARALHFDGPRAKGPFIEFNCASIPSNLVESELFGHEKGAFTDAKDRRVGLVEAADGGTLFLDEVGEMDLLLQAKLLKLLEDRTIRRVGSVKERKVDLRVISATNCNLEQMVQQGKFRRDLFFRLQVVQLDVPPLRDRIDDVPLIAEHFLKRFTRETGRKIRGFTPAAIDKMRAYRWPGNVRELKNVVERAVALGLGPQIDAHEIWLSELDVGAPVVEGGGHRGYHPETLDDVEKRHILETLRHTDWNKSQAAAILGIERSTLDRKIEKFGLVK